MCGGGDRESADTRVVGFDVKNLSSKLNAYTEVRIPELNYSGDYEVQFLFDEKSVKPYDEPTTFLDLYYQLEILALIKQLNVVHGLTIVMVLHDMNQAIRYSGRCLAAWENFWMRTSSRPIEPLHLRPYTTVLTLRFFPFL